MAAFVFGASSFVPACGVRKQNSCAQKRAAPIMGYDMDGTGMGSLEPRRIKSSGVEKDSRCFKVTFCLPSQSRGFTFRELQNVYTTKMVPFSSWYAEQQRIQKMGGKIFKVELVAGGTERSVGNQ